jgi:hypothetical protein
MCLTKHHQTALGNRRYFSIHLNHFELKMETVCSTETVKQLTTVQCKNSKENLRITAATTRTTQSEDGGSAPLSDVGTFNYSPVQILQEGRHLFNNCRET